MNKLNFLPARACALVAMPILLLACGGGGSTAPLGGPLPDVVQSPVPEMPAPVGQSGLTNYQAAEFVLGQQGFEAGQPNEGQAPNGRRLNRPQGVAVAPDGRLFVADTYNNRVLIYPSIGAGFAQDPEHVLGQPHFEITDPRVSREGMNGPKRLAIGGSGDRGKLVVVDMLSHRVLIYDEIPRDGDAIPVAVIGQADFNSGEGSPCGADGLWTPVSAVITPLGQLIVADMGNHRVLVWDRVPATQEEVTTPNLVLGQRDLEHCQFNDDDQDRRPDYDPITDELLVTGNTLFLPMDVWSDGRRLVVADAGNNRVLVWREFPRVDRQAADVVIGQPGPNDRQENAGLLHPTAQTLDTPRAVHSDGTSLAVVDAGNHRVLIWNEFPLDAAAEPDVVLGHEDFERSVTNDVDGDGAPDAPTAHIFHTPEHVLLTRNVLLVADTMNSRILVFRRRLAEEP